MVLVVIAGIVSILVCVSFEHALARIRLTVPTAIAILGAASSFLALRDFNAAIDVSGTEKAVEVVLALLLFVDAAEVRGGLFGGHGRTLARLLAIGLPLTVLAALGTGALLMPDASWAALLVLTCIVVPTDFAHSTGLLRSPHIPQRLKDILNVESGYNDGIIAPLFIVGMSMLDAEHHRGGPALAALEAAPVFAIAIGIGAAVGAASALLVRLALRGRTTAGSGVRVAMALIPLLTYLVATSAGSNGFVAAFVAGIVYRLARIARGGHEPTRDELVFADDLGRLASLSAWFMFGGMTVLVFSTGIDWRVALFALLALVPLRLGPVLLSLIGSPLPMRERVRIGLLGPRGTASIVFGLLAFAPAPDLTNREPLYAMAVVVCASMLLHGALTPRAGVPSAPSAAPSR